MRKYRIPMYPSPAPVIPLLLTSALVRFICYERQSYPDSSPSPKGQSVVGLTRSGTFCGLWQMHGDRQPVSRNPTEQLPFPQTLCARPWHPLSPWPQGDLFTDSPGLPFPECPSQNHTARRLFRLASFTRPRAMTFHGLIVHFVLGLEHIPLFGGFSLLIHSPTEGILVASKVWQLRIKLL